MTLLAWCCAWLLDFLIGDPQSWPHPVRWIGNLIHLVQRAVRRTCHSDRALRIGGGVMWLAVVGLTYGIAWGVLHLATLIHPGLGWGVEVWMIFTVLAGRCLARSAQDVERPLRADDLAESRIKLSWIVGRDTSQLQPEQINRAVVETVAENTVDGIIAPLFFLLLGGAPLAMAYKAVNTLDSMVGYKNDRYLYFGRASAKLDDIVNWIPARLAGLLTVLCAFLVGLDGKNAWKIYRRDCHNHASPNSAQTESACAGALQVQLAGDAYYFGKLCHKPTIGDPIRPVKPQDIVLANRLMVASDLVFAALCCAAWAIVYWLI